MRNIIKIFGILILLTCITDVNGQTKEQLIKKILEKRKTTNYDLQKKDFKAYDKFNNDISNLILDQIQEKLSLDGTIIFYSDTLGEKGFDFSDLNSDNELLLRRLNTKLPQKSINSIIENGYKFNTYAKIPLKYSYQTGTTKFKLKVKRGVVSVNIIKGNPDQFVVDEIKKKFKNRKSGKYIVSYTINVLNKRKNVIFKTLKRK